MDRGDYDIVSKMNTSKNFYEIFLEFMQTIFFLKQHSINDSVLL